METELSLPILSMSILDTILVIIVYCSIFNFVSMIFSEATWSTIINVIILIIFFVLSFYFGSIAREPKYYGSIQEVDGRVTAVINRYPNPNYPGDEKVKIAKNIVLSTPVCQNFAILRIADDTSMSALDDDNAIFNTKEEILCAILIYSVTEICIINILGIYIFSKRELK